MLLRMYSQAFRACFFWGRRWRQPLREGGMPIACALAPLVHLGSARTCARTVAELGEALARAMDKRGQSRHIARQPLDVALCFELPLPAPCGASPGRHSADRGVFCSVRVDMWARSVLSTAGFAHIVLPLPHTAPCPALGVMLVFRMVCMCVMRVQFGSSRCVKGPWLALARVVWVCFGSVRGALLGRMSEPFARCGLNGDCGRPQSHLALCMALVLVPVWRRGLVAAFVLWSVVWATHALRNWRRLFGPGWSGSAWIALSLLLVERLC